MPDIAILSGIAWDHINVFPTYENYLDQFRKFIELVTPGGTLIYSDDDTDLRNLCRGSRNDISLIPYSAMPYVVSDGITSVIQGDEMIRLQIFGKHNMMNLNAARLACRQLGIDDETFFMAIQSFKGASKRLELVAKNNITAIYRDFAHAPSKVLATLNAVRDQYTGRKVIACLELHTYSSLNKEFLGNYAHTLDQADLPIVYFNPHALQIKRLPEINASQIREGFANNGLEVFSNSAKLLERLLEENPENSVFLMMSSGNYDGIDLRTMADKILTGNQ
jgi:UDP-N-acetylmuramate: L-alanyl-gamma-D-glutamyl-meso-diaminopimelate ligase